MKAGGGLTIGRMVRLARVSRASYYRFDENEKSGADSDMDLRDAIQRVALEWPSYGRRRITRELHRRGWAVNWKRVYRLMREDNLLCVRKRLQRVHQVPPRRQNPAHSVASVDTDDDCSEPSCGWACSTLDAWPPVRLDITHRSVECRPR